MTQPIARRAELAWGLAAQAVNVGSGLILLPIVLHYQTGSEVGLWFVFNALANLALLLDCGFAPTIARNVAYACAGAQGLTEAGLPTLAPSGAVRNDALLGGILAASRHIYRRVAALAALALIMGGTPYVAHLVNGSGEVGSSVLAWLCFASGSIITLFYGYAIGALQGRGAIIRSNQLTLLGRLIFLTCGAVTVISGAGLPGLGISALFASIVTRHLAIRMLRDSFGAALSAGLNITPGERQAVIKAMWHNASRLGLVQAGAFLIQRGNILIASSLLGLEVAASYGLTVNLLITLSGVASVVCNTRLPQMNFLQARHDKPGLRLLFRRVVITSWALYLMGFAVLYWVGPPGLELVHSKTHLLAAPLLLLIGSTYLLELNHSIAATYLTTTNRVPFVAAALISGVAVSVLALVFGRWWGALGLVLAQGLVQLAYNNWKWPLEAVLDLAASTDRDSNPPTKLWWPQR